MDSSYLLSMVYGYLFSITVETLVLLPGLSRPHRVATRFFAGIWLTACTYPLLWLVLPYFVSAENRPRFLTVGETLVPLAECGLFYVAFQYGRGLTRGQRWRDWIAIVLANLASFGLGEVVYRFWPEFPL